MAPPADPGLQSECEAARGEGRYAEWLRRTLPPTWQHNAAHMLRIAEHLDALFRGDLNRLQINMPPRHGKTETVTVRGALYALHQAPESQVLVTGYSERFALRLSRKIKNLAKGRIALDAARKANDEWGTLAGGCLMARGVGSPPTGVGFQYVFIDDPIAKRQMADSAVMRENIWDWYADDLTTRLEPGGGIVLTMTRWHEDDLGARVLEAEPGQWTVLKLPALDDDEMPLWPERWPAEELKRKRTLMSRQHGARSWEALYQQNPTPREGDLFRVDQLRRVPRSERPGRELPSVIALDLAGSVGRGDYTALVQMWRDQEGTITIDVARWQDEPYARNERIRAELEARKPQAVVIPQDPGAAGKEAAQHLVRFLAGHPVSTKRVTGSKEIRAEPLAAQVNEGAVRLMESAAADDFVEELRQFPRGKHDDMVDAAADALALSLTQSRRKWEVFTA